MSFSKPLFISVHLRIIPPWAVVNLIFHLAHTFLSQTEFNLAGVTNLRLPL